jgi:hypothetical protein
MGMLSYRDETPERLAHATAIIGPEPGDYQHFLSTLGISPHDTVYLNAGESGGIKEIREFNADLLLSPQFGMIRLGIIKNTEALSFEAQNALLKLLEEPPDRVRIILFITREQTILPTLHSRSRRYYEIPDVTTASSDTEQPKLDQFLATEDLAKNAEAAPFLGELLKTKYQSWRKAGYPLAQITMIEKLLDNYRDLHQGVNARLILESAVLSCVPEESI